MIDVSVPQSPGWWLLRCHRKLRARLPRLELLDSYHRGDPPLPEGAPAARSAYQAFQKKARLNLAELIVGSLRERQTVRSIRTAVDAGTSLSDDVAWSIYRANGLEVEFADVLENMLALGDAYMIAGVNPDRGVDEDLTPADIWLTGEDPRQVVTIHNPARQSQIRAAAKFFHDDDEGRDYAYLFLPGRRFVAYRDRAVTNRPTAITFNPAAWEWNEDGEDGGAFPGLPDLMPVVRFRNRRGVSEFEHHIDILDRINHMILQRMVIATMQAFKQRAIKGDLPKTYPPEHPLAGQSINYDEIFAADPGALWMLPAAVDVWESGQVDLSGILNAVKDDIQNLAAVTRRPLSIFSPDSANQSAEGASLTREGLVFATEDRNTRAGQALAQVLHVAFRLLGDTERADLAKIVVDWMPVERYSLASKGSAAAQAKAAGMSPHWILEHVWQATPEQVAQEDADAAASQLAAAALLAQVSPTSSDNGAAAMAAAPDDAATLKAKFDALGVAVRAGVDPADAAARLGLGGISFTGVVPVSLRLPEVDAGGLEDK